MGMYEKSYEEVVDEAQTELKKGVETLGRGMAKGFFLTATEDELDEFLSKSKELGHMGLSFPVVKEVGRGLQESFKFLTKGLIFRIPNEDELSDEEFEEILTKNRNLKKEFIETALETIKTIRTNNKMQKEN